MGIGNDIIDLEFSKLNSRWKEQRFLDKLFSPDEQGYILQGEDRFKKIWLLWSMKESVHKIVSRTPENQRFNPRDFICKISASNQNRVLFDNQLFHTNSVLRNTFIYTTAFSGATSHCSKWLLLSSKDVTIQHREMKNACIKKYSHLKSIPETSISIQKNAFGIPEMYVGNIIQNELVSITHHGKYGGYALAI